MAHAGKIEMYNSGVCPFAQRAWIALVETKTPFEHKIIDLAKKPKEFTDAYAEINPDPSANSAVPVLIDGDVKLTESAIVAEYVYTKFGQGDLKLSPTERAKIGLLFEWYGKFTSAFFGALRANGADAEAEAKTALVKALQILDEAIKRHGEKRGPYFLGDKYSLAEVLCSSFIQRASVALPHFKSLDPHELATSKSLDRVAEWMDACLSRPSTKETSPSADVIIKGFEKMFAKK